MADKDPATGRHRGDEPAPTGHDTSDVHEKGLSGGSVGLLGSVTLGVSSVAPAYTLTATLGLVVAAVGLKMPAIFIAGFIPMFLTAYAYRELNRAIPDCGTSFTVRQVSQPQNAKIEPITPATNAEVSRSVNGLNQDQLNASPVGELDDSTIAATTKTTSTSIWKPTSTPCTFSVVVIPR